MSTQSGFAVWLTGLPASGKSTLARGLAETLQERDIRLQILDSDELRQVLTPDPTYSREERDWFYSALTYIGRLLTQNGVNVVFAATAPRQAYRAEARQTLAHFVEVYVRCSLETCRARDQKGIYAKALAGVATTVPGIQAPYEAPPAPEVVVDTELQNPEQGVWQIVERLEALSFVKRKK